MYLRLILWDSYHPLQHEFLKSQALPVEPQLFKGFLKHDQEPIKMNASRASFNSRWQFLRARCYTNSSLLTPPQFTLTPLPPQKNPTKNKNKKLTACCSQREADAGQRNRSIMLLPPFPFCPSEQVSLLLSFLLLLTLEGEDLNRNFKFFGCRLIFLCSGFTWDTGTVKIDKGTENMSSSAFCSETLYIFTAVIPSESQWIPVSSTTATC